ncbi:hypothetical protein Hanom_Chr02g00160831 [Helianthus anomalus]
MIPPCVAVEDPSSPSMPAHRVPVNLKRFKTILKYMKLSSVCIFCDFTITYITVELPDSFVNFFN